jgi:regulator of sigma E protease
VVLTGALAIVAVMTVLVGVHEAAHFIVARAMKIRVREFSIGFGRPIVKRRWLDTDFRIGWLPLGGFVKPDRESLDEAAPWRQGVMYAAGPVASVLLGIATMTAGFMYGGTVWLGEPSDKVQFVRADSDAARIGIRPGDRISGCCWFSAQDVGITLAAFAQGAGQESTIQFLRDGDGEQVLPIRIPDDGRLESFGVLLRPLWLDASSDRTVIDAPASRDATAFRDAAGASAGTAAAMTAETARLFTDPGAARDAASQITGPVGIARMTARASRSGLGDLLAVAGLLSVAIGLFNALPIPPADGGRIVIALVETVMGKRLPERLRIALLLGGLVVMLLLIGYTVFNDVSAIMR